MRFDNHPGATSVFEGVVAGRSNVLICAALVADGQAATFQEAHEIVRRQRPRAKLNKRQFQSLVDWSAWRDGQKTKTR